MDKVRARMRRLAAAALLALPALLAFGRGGYFGVTRVRVAILACLLLALAAFVGRTPTRNAAISASGLAALTAWTGCSVLWAPVKGSAFADLERLMLYTAAFTAGVMVLREWVEEALLATIAATALYGLSERLLPSVFSLPVLPAAGDRLAQPLTYWNGQGALAALGLVLAAGLAARGQRLAAAAAPVLGLDLYLTLSRGAIGAGLAGLAVLVALQPTKATLRATLTVGAAAALAALAALALDGVATVDGARGQGAAMIVILAALSAGAYFVRGDDRALPRLRPLATGAVIALLAGTIVAVATSGSQGPASRTDAERLVSVQSNRYAYWRVAAEVVADHPLTGVGSGGFAVAWLQRRDIAEGVRDAHSLYLETAAELGVIGVAALAAFIAGIVLAARRGEPVLVAALVTFALHAGLDWDWELPALSLTALLLAAKLVSERAA
jgi:O-antigen ligase